jgi:hypothetical protein
MNRTEGRDTGGRKLTTADLAAAGREPRPAALEDEPPEVRIEREQRRADSPSARSEGLPSRERERLEPLFPQDVAERYRSEWAAVQSSFVDDPRQAAARGDELVAQVMKGLAASFAHEREQLEQELSRSGEASTETLRIGFRRYRSFFDRLLAL